MLKDAFKITCCWVITLLTLALVCAFEVWFWDWSKINPCRPYLLVLGGSFGMYMICILCGNAIIYTLRVHWDVDEGLPEPLWMGFYWSCRWLVNVPSMLLAVLLSEDW